MNLTKLKNDIKKIHPDWFLTEKDELEFDILIANSCQTCTAQILKEHLEKYEN